MSESRKPKPPHDGAFYPGVVYPLRQVAINLQVSEKWVKENLIYQGKCDHKKQGNVYFFLGEWLADWCRRDFKQLKHSADSNEAPLS